MKKNPILASILSAFVFPGIGQIYNKQYKKGLGILLPSAVASFYILKPLVLSYIKFIRDYAEAETIDIFQIKMQIAFHPNPVITLVMTIIWVYAIIDAYISARKNQQHTLTKEIL